MSTLGWLLLALVLTHALLLVPTENCWKWLGSPLKYLKRSKLTRFRPHRTRAEKLGFQDLPLELVLKILQYPATSSQSAYRSLVLTSRAMRDIVRLEFLPHLPIIIIREAQFDSFLEFVQSDPKVGSAIRYLWMIHLDYHCINLPEQILTFCPNIVALACQPQSLLSFLSASPDAVLKNCRELTLHDRVVSSWECQNPNVLAFCSQIERLHLIGPFLNGWTIPSFPNLRAASISYGKKVLDVRRFQSIFFECSQLQKIAVVTELGSSKLAHLQTRVSELNKSNTLPEITVMLYPEDLTDIRMWLDGLYDKDLFWNSQWETFHL